jgi:hypothetical protein
MHLMIAARLTISLAILMMMMMITILQLHKRWGKMKMWTITLVAPKLVYETKYWIIFLFLRIDYVYYCYLWQKGNLNSINASFIQLPLPHYTPSSSW